MRMLTWPPSSQPDAGSPGRRSAGGSRSTQTKKGREAMTAFNRIALISSAALLGAFVLAAPARAEENKWPGTKAGEPTPKPKGVPAVLANNLANFDDLAFPAHTTPQAQDLHKTHTTCL